MLPKKSTADELLTKGNDFYARSEWDKALKCWEKAKEMYEKLNDTQGISNALDNIGLVYRIKGEWEHALEYHEKSLKIAEELGDRQGISNALNNIGLVYQNKGEWERALEYHEKSLKIAEEFGNRQSISTALGNVGAVYQYKGEWEHALEYYEKSLKIAEELGDKTRISSALNNIGLVYRIKGEWERALEYLEKSLKIDEELGDRQGISYSFNNIGEMYQNKGEWERALEYYEKSLKIKEELGDEQSISVTLNNIGEINIISGNWNDARNYLEKALSIAEKLAPISTVDALTNLGELFRLEEKYREAFRKLEDALQIVQKIGAKPQEIIILKELADTHIDEYNVLKENTSLSMAENFYNQALELATSLNTPLQEATAIRGIGVVQAKKGELEASKKSFMNSILTLRRLGAIFELQKTLLEYGKVLYESNELIEAEMVAKNTAFDALHNDYKELLVKAYLLLGDIVMKQEKHYGYYLDALKASKFNFKLYMRTCFIMIFRMRNMQEQMQLDFLKVLKDLNKDMYFDRFLEALCAKIEGRKYDISGLPSSLEEEFKKF